MGEWHENREFWEILGPVMFTKERRLQAKLDIQHLVQLLDLKNGMRILDMACGMGIHSCELAGSGFRVTGVDPIESYIRNARQEAKDRDLDVDFTTGDMRSYLQEDEFDAVLILGTSFGIFQDESEERGSLENMHRSLRDGGRLVLEAVGKDLRKLDFPAHHSYEAEGITCTEEHKLREDGEWVDSRLTVQRGDGEVRSFAYSYRLYTREDMTDLVHSCGFTKVALNEDFSGNEYTDASRKMIVIAVK